MQEDELVRLARDYGTLRYSVSGEQLVMFGGDAARPVLRFHAE